MKRTIVQHSGYGYVGKPEFEHAVESRAVPNMQVAKVVKAGGLLFESYAEAENFCDQENYQPDNMGLIPHAPGTFADLEVDGLRVYVPATVTAA